MSRNVCTVQFVSDHSVSIYLQVGVYCLVYLFQVFYETAAKTDFQMPSPKNSWFESAVPIIRVRKGDVSVKCEHYNQMCPWSSVN